MRRCQRIERITQRCFEHARNTTTITCRKYAFAERNIVQCLCIECTEESKQVPRIVDWNSIKENQILVIASTTYMKTAGKVALSLYAR